MPLRTYPGHTQCATWAAIRFWCGCAPLPLVFGASSRILRAVAAALILKCLLSYFDHLQFPVSSIPKMLLQSLCFQFWAWSPSRLGMPPLRISNSWEFQSTSICIQPTWPGRSIAALSSPFAITPQCTSQSINKFEVLKNDNHGIFLNR